MFALMILLAAAPAPVAPAPAPPQPSWISQPSPETVEAAFPVQALSAGVSGTATLECESRPDGGLQSCVVSRESVPGYGFGEAALTLTGAYRLSPDYLAVASGQTVAVTIQWLHADYRRAAAAAAADRYDQVPFIETKKIVWARRASGDDVARYYPDAALQAREKGQAVVICFVTITGSLSDCRALEEVPEKRGFGDASVRMMRLFRTKPLDTEGRPVAGKAVRMNITFEQPE